MDALLAQRPQWNPKPHSRSTPFFEFWTYRAVDIKNSQALFLRLSLQINHNGFTRNGEVLAIYSKRIPSTQEVQKIALRRSYEISEFAYTEEKNAFSLGMGPCLFSNQGTHGTLRSAQKLFSWNLEIKANEGDQVLSLFQKTLQKKDYLTPHSSLHFEGTTQLGDTHSQWNTDSGHQTHWSGIKLPSHMIWSQANQFVDSAGKPADFLFEALSTQRRLVGPIKTPTRNIFFIKYKGDHFRLHSFWDPLKTKTTDTGSEWSFQAEKGPYLFKGVLKSESRFFSGITLENTDGDPLIFSHSPFADLTVWIYRGGKLEDTMTCRHSAFFERISLDPSPTLQILA